jgi:alpha-L-rhamnosidase
VTVPVSTRATVFVPARSPEAVEEAGRPAANAPGIRFLRQENGAAIFEVGSGRYSFVSR